MCDSQSLRPATYECRSSFCLCLCMTTCSVLEVPRHGPDTKRTQKGLSLRKRSARQRLASTQISFCLVREQGADALLADLPSAKRLDSIARSQWIAHTNKIKVQLKRTAAEASRLATMAEASRPQGQISLLRSGRHARWLCPGPPQLRHQLLSQPPSCRSSAPAKMPALTPM